jgi:uridine monophosphate synthetase
MHEVALALHNSKALRFGSFKIKSGVQSPYYIDLTRLLSAPKDFRCVVDAISDEIRKMMVVDRIDRLASIELKGALILPSVASKLNIPSIIVRKTRKQYGIKGRISGGEIINGEQILFFDDVISDGNSKLEGIRPLEKLGAMVKHVLVVVDREQGGRNIIEGAGYRFHALMKISDLIEYLLQSKKISEDEARAALDFTKKFLLA